MRNKRQGFTLVEVLIVVAIIAILAAMTLPTYQINSTKARISTAIPLLDSLMHDLLIKYFAHGMPPATFNGVSGAGAGGYGPYVTPNVSSYLHYVSGNGWNNVGAMVAVSVPPIVAQGVPGYVASTDGSDGNYNTIAIAFFDNQGTIELYCGRWDSASTLYIPVDYLPPGCDSDNFQTIVTGL